MSSNTSKWKIDRVGLVWIMRAFPYTLQEAIADIIDNSIDAGAKNILVEVNHIENQQYDVIKDDGFGIASTEMDNVASIGRRREYKEGDLGHFGVGLKLAGLSHAKNVTIFSKEQGEKMSTRRISVDWMQKSE